MPAGQFHATLTATPPLTVAQFYATPPVTPGNVGVCLSGGGSRALTAGMGQLQALKALGLLGKVRALSTVSGGSWLGVPFEYLPATGISDDAYLGTYVPDPGTLTSAQILGAPFGAACVPLNSDSFSPVMLALEAFAFWTFVHIPANMVWQTLIAHHILRPLGLFTEDSAHLPADYFSYNSATQDAIVAANPPLRNQACYLFADQLAASRVKRPFLICNMAMFLNEVNLGTQLLAPVQSSAFLSGICGSPVGTDANGLPPGGGGVTPFAFNSSFVAVNNASVAVNQGRQWSLTDAVGTSSAFFAEVLQNQFEYWRTHISEFFAQLRNHLDEILPWIDHHLPLEARTPSKMAVSALAAHSGSPFLDGLAAKLIHFPSIGDLVPRYQYWPATQTSPVPNSKPTGFADGGNLENSGICGLLAYQDIDNVITFINSEQPMVQGVAAGVTDGAGGFLSGTNVHVDDTIPPLFGYQPFNAASGYVPYPAGGGNSSSQYAHSQVFDAAAFPDLLRGLAAAAGANAHPAVFVQSNLTVQANKWFGVAGGKSVNVVWNYLNASSDFVTLLKPEVAALVDGEFPNYKTLNTDLRSRQTNLLSTLTAWCVVKTDQATGAFSQCFT